MEGSTDTSETTTRAELAMSAMVSTSVSFQSRMRESMTSIAAETPEVTKRPPIVEAPPDSQASGIRRGAGYAPSRSNFPPPAASSPRVEPALRATPAKPLTKAALRATPVKPHTKAAVRTPPAEAQETPQQRRAAILLIFLFAALLAVAVYFFLRRAPSPNGQEPPRRWVKLVPSWVAHLA